MKRFLTILVLPLLAVLLGCPRGHYHVGVDTRIHGRDCDEYYDSGCNPDYYRYHDRYYGRDYDRYRYRRHYRHRGLNIQVAPQESSVGIIIEVRAPTEYERIRIQKLADSLNFSGQPMPGWWRIVILPPVRWEDALRYYHLEGRTASAFTIMGQNETLVSEDYAQYHGGDQVRFTLGHEAGHLICQCQSEDRANDIARILTKKPLAN
jgi:hypothetical protein